ncbi:MAG: MTH1187 family thiamine-binding protein [Armatimonadetes bacterium]|nr:MTH1187 family thiamine-binding protein [Armatimonadota bacterium]
MAVMQIKILPLGTGSPAMSEWVAAAVRVVEESGLKYQLTPMATVVEGDLDALLALARKVHEAPFQAGAQRVVTIIDIDDRRDRPQSMEEKVEAVQKRLKGPCCPSHSG